MEDLKTLYDDNGYTVYCNDTSIFLASRCTFPAALAAAIAGGVAAMTAIGGSNLLASANMAGAHAHQEVVALGMLVVALFSAVLAATFYRIYARNRDLSLGRVPLRWIVDLSRRTLCAADGREICPTDQVRVTIGTNLLNATRGLMRTLNMNWPGGRACIMTSGDMSEIERMRRVLVEAGMVRRGLD